MTTTPVLSALASLAHEKRELDARLIVAAGEFAALSDRSLDKDGLSRRAGYARPELMLADLWHVTVQEAKRYCTVGLATRARQALDGTPLPAEYPIVAAAIASCELGIAAAEIIVRELEAAASRCSTEKRQIAEHELVTRAPDFTIADLHTLARRVR
ncbi:MAG: endonuclease, partial [Microbacteriaceae bacterium]|nr:endonuclease [Microbacteriaceae bacterium]